MVFGGHILKLNTRENVSKPATAICVGDDLKEEIEVKKEKF